MTVCAGSLMHRPCEQDGIIPFERSPGYTVMLCRMCHYQERIEEKICDAQMLVRIVDGIEERARCQEFWTHLYTTSEGNVKRLCGFHFAGMDMLAEIDRRSAHENERPA